MSTFIVKRKVCCKCGSTYEAKCYPNKAGGLSCVGYCWPCWRKYIRARQRAIHGTSQTCHQCGRPCEPRKNKLCDACKAEWKCSVCGRTDKPSKSWKRCQACDRKHWRTLAKAKVRKRANVQEAA